MIQLKRGNTNNWRKLKKPLAAGQPGYDKDKHKIKIGDGESTWGSLPYASGLSAEEILDSEKDAKSKNLLDPEDKTLITYGTESPNKGTIGQLYLQYYDTAPEVDYVVSYGTDGIWTYQKWHSGIAKCWGTLTLETAIKTAFEGVALYHNNKIMKNEAYPFTFVNTPSETATLGSPAGVVWLAGKSKNTKSKSGAYSLISPDKLASAKYVINIQVEGFWK